MGSSIEAQAFDLTWDLGGVAWAAHKGRAPGPRWVPRSTSMTKPNTLRRWTIPLASLVPLAAIAFAFSLGPSPHRRVADYLRSDAPPAERQAALASAGPEATWALAQRVVERDLPRRAEAIAYLGRVGGPRIVWALERVLASDAETPEMRKEALEAALSADRRRGLALAEDLAGREDALGEAARRALAVQERSDVARPGPALN
jgi:hypothetical protein